MSIQNIRCVSVNEHATSPASPPQTSPVESPRRVVGGVLRLAAGFAAVAAFPALAQFVTPPTSSFYGFGDLPAIAISGTSIIEVHQGGLNGFGPLWYRPGRIQADGTVLWVSPALQYDQGGRPSVAVCGSNVIEVHQGTEKAFGPLWYRTGQIQLNGTVNWSNSFLYDNGGKPSVVLSGTNIVEVHQGTGDGYGPLWYKTGRILPNGTVAWSATAYPYDNGGAPRIAASGPNLIEVHEGSADGYGPLWFKTAEIQNDGTVAWNDKGFYYETGAAPAVALDGATVLEVHQGSSSRNGPLWYHAGQIQADGSVVWNPIGFQYDIGAAPTIALAGAIGLEVHQVPPGWDYYRPFRY